MSDPTPIRPEATPPPSLPYATPASDRAPGALVPLGSGFALLLLGLLALVFGRIDLNSSRLHVDFGDDPARMLIVVVGLGLVIVGVVIIFRALRKFDW